MKTSKSPLRQMPSCSLFFGFLILFARGALGNKTLNPEPTTLEPSTMVGSFPKNLTTTDTDVDVSTEAHTIAQVLATTTSHEEAHSTAHVLATTNSHDEETPASELAPGQPSTLKHVEPETVAARREPATLKQTKRADTTITSSHEVTWPATTTPKTTATTKVQETPIATVGEPASFNTTIVGNTGLKPRSSKGKVENTTPGQRVLGDPTAHDTSSRGPETTYTMETSSVDASEADSRVTEGPSKGSRGVATTPAVTTPRPHPTSAASPTKASQGVIVAVVLSVLLLMVLLIALLCCWRRRRSGSTSFKTTGWAGQAALPDDSGLDKEVEQGAMAAGEGETRRATLTTFFGKRQSRVPSVAMEDIVRKEPGDVEEAQHLIDEDASNLPDLEGSGEANGRLPESTEQCSQEKEFPPPPASQETPPTQQE